MRNYFSREEITAFAAGILFGTIASQWLSNTHLTVITALLIGALGGGIMIGLESLGLNDISLGMLGFGLSSLSLYVINQKNDMSTLAAVINCTALAIGWLAVICPASIRFHSRLARMSDENRGKSS